MRYGLAENDLTSCKLPLSVSVTILRLLPFIFNPKIHSWFTEVILRNLQISRQWKSTLF